MPITGYPKGKFPRSAETRKKTSESAKRRANTAQGKKQLDEARALVDYCGWNLGKTWELRQKTVAKMKGRTSPNKGVKMSESQKQKISDSKRGKTPWNKGLQCSDKEYERLRRMGTKSVRIQQLNKRPTSIEVKLYDYLWELGVSFDNQELINEKFLVDAFLPKFNMVIEADGDYWHALPATVKRDKAKNAYLTKCGFNLLRIPNGDSIMENIKI